MITSTGIFQYIYIALVSSFLLGAGLLHVFKSEEIARLMSRKRSMQFVGVLIVVFGWPPLFFRNPYFLTVGLIFLMSGLARLAIPSLVIRFMQSAYPRWVHGVLLIGASLLNFLIPLVFIW